MTHARPFRFRAIATTLLAALTLCAALRAADATPAYPPEPRDPRSKEHDAWVQNLTAGQYVTWQADETTKAKQGWAKLWYATEIPTPASGYDWRTAAAHMPCANPTYSFGIVTSDTPLDAATLASLEKNKIAYGPSLKQSFEPYLNGPVFITTDSWLNGFHALFEDSFRELEIRNARQLRENLELLLASAREFGDNICNKDINFPPDRYAIALRNTQLLLGPAILLMGGSPELFDAPLRDEISAQAEKIRRADSAGLPDWLAPADTTLTALDYRRCKPIGFYANDENLAAYYRAMRWLQMVPLRAFRLAEMDAAMLIGLAGGGMGQYIGNINLSVQFQRIARLIGPPDEPSPFDLMRFLDGSPHPFQRNFDFSKQDYSRVSYLMGKLIDSGYYQVNTDPRRKTTMRDSLANLVSRMIPAARAPDTILFQGLADKKIPPTGLAIAAMLRSPFATEKLSPLAREIAENARENLWQPENKNDPYEVFHASLEGMQIYDYYLRTLEALFHPPESDSPPFMQNESWKAKSCQTALAGWAQLTRTLALRPKTPAKIDYTIHFGYRLVPFGFVEPNPEFFARAGDMVDKAIDTLDATQCFQPAAQAEAIKLWKTIASLEKERTDLAPTDTMETFLDKKRKNTGGFAFTLELERLITRHATPQTKAALASPVPEKFREGLGQLTTTLNSIADALDQSIVNANKDEDHSVPLRRRWEKLRDITHKLESLAHKQLRAQTRTSEEDDFLKTYGNNLAIVMNCIYARDDPPDDAPRWAEAARDPQRDTALAVAIGRPRYLYVLYPWNGVEILCKGSVMQYYEYETTPAATPLTDTEWLKQLDTPAAPALPAWQRDFATPPEKRLKD